MEEDEVVKEQDRELAWETELDCNPLSLWLICLRIWGNHFNPKHFHYSSCPVSFHKPLGPFVQRGDLLSYQRWVFRVPCNINKELKRRKWCLLPHGERIRADVPRNRQVRKSVLLQALLTWGYSLFHDSTSRWDLKGSCEIYPGSCSFLFEAAWESCEQQKKTLGLSVCRISKMIRRHLHCSLTQEVIFVNIWPGVKYVFFWKTVAKSCGH